MCNRHTWHFKFLIFSMLGNIILFIPWHKTKPVFVLARPIKTVVAAISTSILIIHAIFLGVQLCVQL